MDLKLEVYEKTFELVDTLSGIDSAVWRVDAFSAGSFTIAAYLTQETATLLKPENMVWMEGDTLALIEAVDKTADEDGTQHIIAKGRMVTALLDRRVLWGTYNLSGSPTALMRYLVEDCCVSPTRGQTTARIMPNFNVSDAGDGSYTIRLQRTGTGLLEALEDIGEAHQVPYRLSFDPAACEVTFVCSYGVDRSIHQDDVDPVLFSTELDDVIASSYSYDSESYRNVALIGGQIDEETEVRTYVAIEPDVSGLDRRELFVDARDMSISNGEETLTEEQYQQALLGRGHSKLSDHKCAESFEVDVLTTGATYQYGVDFNLGDTITVVDERLELSIDAVVTAVTKSVARSGETLSLTLGYSQPTLSKYIRKAVN